jgi:hypothetical protein
MRVSALTRSRILVSACLTHSPVISRRGSVVGIAITTGLPYVIFSPDFPTFSNQNICPGGFYKFVEMFCILTICYISTLVHILMVLRMQKKKKISKF